VTRVSPGDAEANRQVERVHSASTRSITAEYRPSRPYTPYRACCRDFVPVHEHPWTLVTASSFHGKEGVVGSSPTEGSTTWIGFQGEPACQGV
jgi:hypothetical protein